MKELKFIKTEIWEIRLQDEMDFIERAEDYDGLPKHLDCTYEDKYELCGYDVSKAKADLKELQWERSNLQIAIDKANLASVIDCYD